MDAAYGDFGGFFVVHFQDESGVEPGDDFLDVLGVHEEGAVRAPEGFGIERGVQLFERAVVGRAFDVARHDDDGAAFGRGENNVFAVDEEQALLRLHQYFHFLRGAFGGAELTDELFEALGRGSLRIQHFSRALNSFGDARLVERLQHVIDGVHVEGLYRVLIEGRRKDHVRHFHFAFDELFQDAEAIEAGHLHVEKNEIGRVLFDQRYRFHAVFALADQIDFGEGLQ